MKEVRGGRERRTVLGKSEWIGLLGLKGQESWQWEQKRGGKWEGYHVGDTLRVFSATSLF